MAVKMASVATVHLGWEEGEKILEMHYMSHGAELRFGLFFLISIFAFVLLLIISQFLTNCYYSYFTIFINNFVL